MMLISYLREYFVYMYIVYTSIYFGIHKNYIYSVFIYFVYLRTTIVEYLYNVCTQLREETIKRGAHATATPVDLY